jgi:hypothetical protein
MKLSTLMERQLNERSMEDIVSSWYAFRNAYVKLLKSIGKDAARRHAESWLGDMSGYRDADQLKRMLKNAGMFDPQPGWKPNPEIDKLLMLTVDNIFKKREEEKAQAEKDDRFKKEKHELNKINR